MRIRGWGSEGDVVRVLLALALVLWGLSLGLHGLGSATASAAHLFDVWWPAPFLAYGLGGLALDRGALWGGRTMLYLGAAAVSAAILAAHLTLSGVNVGNLVWAAILVFFGVLFLGPRGWRW
jgi:hypothetical protein